MFGARGEIRTRHKAGLKSAASSNWATRARARMKDERRCPPVSASALSSFILPTSSLIGTGGMSDKLQLVAGSVKKLLSHAHDKLKLIGPRLAEGTGVEPASDRRAVVFGTTALPVRLPFQEEFRIANCGSCFSPEIFCRSRANRQLAIGN